MHLSVRRSQLLEEGDGPVDPHQTPAEMLALSFTDSDLACLAEAYRLEKAHMPTFRLTNLSKLKHPLSVDLYLEKVAAHARVIFMRVLGGYEWWRYGAEELHKLAKKRSVALAMISGDGRTDARLAALSTIAPDTLMALEQCMTQGGMENVRACLHTLAALANHKPTAMPAIAAMPNGAFYREAMPQTQAGRATIIFYRAHTLSADTAPIDALLDALAERGLHARAFMVTSLKDTVALAALQNELGHQKSDIIIDATAFSAAENNAHPTSGLNVPILQVALSNGSLASWEASARGMGPSDLVMHVVLPEADGRIFTRAISFKAETAKDEAIEFTRIVHAPHHDRLAYVAELAAAWVSLAKKKADKRRIALVLSDYPARAGRNAYAVGLDAPQSAVHILQLLAENHYGLSDIPDSGNALIEALHGARKTYSLAEYQARLLTLPPENRKALADAWGAPENDASFKNGAFHLPVLICGNATVALQPDRGSRLDRKASYHDPLLPPRHGYLAFYWWLKGHGLDALIHLGTHGNLEWLPGKTAALSARCWPEIALGSVPVVYPYIVSDPGEAAQAKRRISAITLSHLTPPLTEVSLSPQMAELERLTDEYAQADGLDARRMKLLKAEILHQAQGAGLPGLSHTSGEDDIMANLEAQLCDIKEQRVADGLHIFGQSADDCGTAERNGLLTALSGGFVPPSPGGSPARGRLDVLPTGRNLIATDPRAIPTRTAAAIGRRAAEEFVRRYAQDHGDWPKTVMIDLWGTSTLRTGGDDIAQALCLMGVLPLWDGHSQRVTGFEILESSEIAWPRIDVSLRISGMFRDMFANLIILFDDAVRAVASLEEDAIINPLAEARRNDQPLWRIFGGAPGTYGAGITELLDAGRWSKRDELGCSWLESSHYTYGRNNDGTPQPQALMARVTASDALLHAQDQRVIDVLEGADFADAEGGFAAAAASLGAAPSLYHLDTSRPEAIKARTLAEEISLTLQARALSSAWMEGQMRHGYAGAAAMASVVDQLFAFAATTDTISPRQFDAVFDAYIHDETLREFLRENNPDALKAMAERFDEAIRRGLWNPLRNSVHALLEALREPKKERAA